LSSYKIFHVFIKLNLYLNYCVLKFKIEKIKIGDLEELEDKEFNFDQEFSTIEYLKIRPEYDNEKEFLKNSTKV